MRLNRVVLEQFRSYEAAELLVDPGLTVVTGPNGAGKTNLLEAIVAAVTGRSPRAAHDQELVRSGAPHARVRLDLGEPDGRQTARLELFVPAADAPPQRKRIALNGIPRRSTTVGEVVRVVLFRPEEMLLLVGPPSERRRFLDAILAQRDRMAARDLADLARILAQRNALLRAIRAEEADADGLAIWDEPLIEVGSRLMAARLRLVDELAERLEPLHRILAPAEAGEPVRLVYVDSLKGHAGPQPPVDALRLAMAFRRRLAEVRQKELWHGLSLVGPQRDDLRVELGGRDVAQHASRGQQRTLILALKLAESGLLASDGPAPVVLLDDVFSELDPDRSAHALDLLRTAGQVLVTTADLGSLPGRHRRAVSIWRVDAGRLTQAPRVA
jgi:DNA replication and repair protein RecF